MAITVPVVDQEITVSGFGKPVADQINLNITDIAALKTLGTVQTAVTLQNGYTLDAWANFVYVKVGPLVWLSFGLNVGTNQAVAFQLPAGYFPRYNMRVGIQGFSGGGTPAPARLDFYTNGQGIPMFTAATTIGGVIVYPFT